ncbi:MAG: S-layer homology domain-containing protein [Candidatus Peregrinibacteria bacterium]
MLPKIIPAGFSLKLFFKRVLSVVLSLAIIIPMLVEWRPLTVSAAKEEEYDLVAILVSDNLYEVGREDNTGTLTGKIYRYARDVQAALPRTKALVLPIPEKSTPPEIYSILEKLYLEGEIRGNNHYKLKGAVFLGNIGLPTISDGKYEVTSVFPYTDFTDTVFTWQQDVQKFIRNASGNSVKAEIWHGVLNGSSEELSAFFDKNHTTHEKIKNGEMPADDKVFFADLTAESKGVFPEMLGQYEARQTFAEDLAYYRYNKHLYKRVNEAFSKNINPSEGKDDDGDGKIDEDGLDLKDNDGDGKVDEDPGNDFLGIDNDHDGKIDEDERDGKDNDGDGQIDEDPSTSPFNAMLEESSNALIPDIKTKEQIEKLLPPYPEVVNSYGQDALLYIQNSGRWDGQTATTVPKLIYLMDTLSSEVLKSVNTQWENEITNRVQTDWQRTVRVVTNAIYTEPGSVKRKGFSYPVSHFIHGQNAAEISNAEECSYLRGSPRTDAAVNAGINSVQAEMSTTYQMNMGGVNLNTCNMLGGCCALNYLNPGACVPNNAVQNIFTPTGSKEIQGADNSFTACRTVNLHQVGVPGPFPIANNGFFHSFNGKEISSVVVHNEPRGETITKMLSSLFVDALPSDGVRYISFQNPVGDERKLPFPNLFTVAPEGGVPTIPALQTALQNAQNQKENEIITSMVYDSFSSYIHYIAQQENKNLDENTKAAIKNRILNPLKAQYPDITEEIELLKKGIYEKTAGDFSAFLAEGGRTIRVPLSVENNQNCFQGTTYGTAEDFFANRGTECNAQIFQFPAVKNIPQPGFLALSKFHVDPAYLALFLRWKSLSIDEKHQEVFSLFLNENAPYAVQKPKNGYSLAYLATQGDGLAWQTKEAKTEDPQYAAFQEAAAVQTNTANGQNSPTEEETKDECGPPEGVPIWEWIPAVFCWLKNLAKKGIITTAQCSYQRPKNKPYTERNKPWEKSTASAAATLEVQTFSQPLIASVPNTFRFVFLDDKKQQSKGSFYTITVSSPHPEQFTWVENDANPFMDGFQVATYSGEAFLHLIPNAGVPNISLSITAENLGTQVLTVPVETNPQLELSVVGNATKGLVKGYEVSATLKDSQNQPFEKSEIEVSAAVDNPTEGVVTPETVSMDGTSSSASFSVGVRSDKKITVFATSPGVRGASLDLSGIALEENVPTSMQIFPHPTALSLRSSTNYEVKFLNAFGKEIPVTDKAVSVTITDNSKALATASVSGNTLTIATGGKTGMVRGKLTAANVGDFLFEIPISVSFDNKFFQENPINALYTIVTGTPLGKFGTTRPQAEQMVLNSQKAEAISAPVSPALTTPWRATVTHDGTLNITDNAVEAVLSSTEPLRVSLFDPLSFTPLAAYQLRFLQTPELFLRAPKAGETGIFFENFDGAGKLNATKENDKITVLLENTPILSLTNQGSATLLDRRFSLEVEKNTTKSGMSLLLKLDHQKTLGRITFAGGELVPIFAPVWNTIPLPIARAGETGFAVVDYTDVPEEMFAGLTGRMTKGIFGSGWEGDDPVALGFASGNTVGGSTVSSNDVLSITFGDPTIALIPPSPTSVHFDKTVGTEIFSTADENISGIQSFDFDGDGIKDIAVWRSGKGGELLTADGNGGFRHWGEFLKTSTGIRFSTAGKYDTDSFEDIALAGNIGLFSFFKNTNGVFSPWNDLDPASTADDFFTKTKILHAETADMDKDGYDDLVVLTEEGKIEIWYGGKDGIYSGERKEVDKFQMTLDPKDQSADLSISFVGMKSIYSGQTEIVSVPKTTDNKEGVINSFAKQSGDTTAIESKDAMTKNFIDLAQEDIKNTSLTLDFSTVQTDISNYEFAPLPAFAKDFSILSKTSTDENGGALQMGDTVKTTITLQTKLANAFAFSLQDRLPPLSTLDTKSIQVTGGGNGWKQTDTPDGSTTLLLFNLVLSPNTPLIISYTSTVSDLPKVSFSIGDQEDEAGNKDTIRDIFISLPPESTQDTIVYQSTGNRSYIQRIIPPAPKEAIPAELDMTDANGNGIPDRYEKDSNNDGIADYADKYFDAFKKDSDGDGIPDAWDNTPNGNFASLQLGQDGNAYASFNGSNALDTIADKANNIIDVYNKTTCGTGNGCFSMPINYAFLVPGPTNIAGQILGQLTGGLGGGGGGASGTSTGIGAVDSATSSIAGLVNQLDGAIASALEPITSAISDAVKGVLDKVGLAGPIDPFVMPIFGFGVIPGGTITCLGYGCIKHIGILFIPVPLPLGYPLTQFRFYISPALTGGIGIVICKGIAGAYPIPVGGFCFTQAIPPSLFCSDKNASSMGQQYSFGSGQRLFHVGLESNRTDSRATFNGLNKFPLTTPSSNNTRVNGSPGFFARWWNRQIEEVASIFTLPTITIYAPDVFKNLNNLGSFVINNDKKNEALKKIQDKWNSDIIPKSDTNTEKTTAVTAQNAQKEQSLLAQAASGINSGIKSVYDTLEPIKQAGENIGKKLSIMSDFSDLLESVPLLHIKRVPVNFNIPIIPRSELLSTIGTWENWSDDALAEMQSFVRDLTGNDQCASSITKDSLGKNSTVLSDCFTAKVGKDAITAHVLTDAQKYYSQVQQNIAALKSYLDIAQLLSDLDNRIAEYIYTVVCYVNAVTDLIGGWITRNKKIIEGYIKFYKTVKAILDGWKLIAEIGIDYAKYCKKCQAGNHDSLNIVWSLIGSVLPSPPIIKFPRLPDIVLDLSDINAGFTIPLPVLSFTPKEVRLPKLPNLALPRTPDINFKFPDLPVLVPFTLGFEVPALPALTIPKLPDLPPPPKIPKILGSLTGLLKIAKTALTLYCIFRRGFFVFPEFTIKSTVEWLTERPSNPLSMDWLSKQSPDYQIPSIAEIRVRSEVNLDFDLSETGILKPFQAMAQEWNAKSDSLFNQTQSFNSPTSNLGNFSNPVENKTVNVGQDLNIPKTINPLPDSISPADNKMINGIIQSELQKLAPLLKDKDTLVSVEEMQKIMNIPSEKIILPPFKMTAAVNLKKELEQERQKISDQSQKMIAMQDDLGKFVAEENRMFTSANSIYDGVPNLPKAPSDLQNLPTPEITPKEGLYIYDESTKESVHILAANLPVLTSTFMDIDRDGDEDIVYATKRSVFWKENRNTPHTKESLTTDPEVGDISFFLPVAPAPQNPVVSDTVKSVSLSVIPSPNEHIIGAEILLRNSVTASVRHNASLKKRAIFVFASALSVPLTPAQKNVFQVPNSPLTIAGKEWKTEDGEAVMVGDFTGENFDIPLEEGFWTTQIRWILDDGSVSTLSTPVLSAPRPSVDKSAPFGMGNPLQVGYLYKANTIKAPLLFDGESALTYEWDTNGDGQYDTVGKTITTGIYTEPKTITYPLKVTDSGGNTTFLSVSVSIKSPEIFMNTDAVPKKIIEGTTLPGFDKTPVSILRTRWNTTKKIKTPTANAQGNYFTNANGEYKITDFDLSRNAIIKDNAGKIIGEVVAESGRLLSKNSDYTVGVLPGNAELPMRQVLLSKDKTIVANSITQVSGENAVQLFLQPLGNADPNALLKTSGVAVFDDIPQNDISFGPLPASAPSFPEGAVIFNTQTKTPLAMISKFGDIQYLSPTGLALEIAPTTETNPLLLNITLNGIKEFEVLVKGTFAGDIRIDQTHTAGGKIASTTKMSSSLNANSTNATSTAVPLPFSDIAPDNSALPAITDLYNRGILNGYDDGSFRPDELITRAEFVKIALGTTDCLDCTNPTEFEKQRFLEALPFPDVTVSEWFHFCVSKAKKLSMIMGYGDGLFKPSQNISRAEAVAILLRQSHIPLTKIPTKPVHDVNPQAWYFDAVITAVNMGMIQSTFGFTFPDQYITRAEFATMAEILLSQRDCRVVDSDGDGIPDYLEIANGLDEKNPADGNTNRDNLLDPQKNKTGNAPLPAPSDTGNSNNTLPKGDNGSIGPQKVMPENLTPSPENATDVCIFVPSNTSKSGCPEILDPRNPDGTFGKNKTGSGTGTPTPGPTTETSTPTPTIGIPTSGPTTGTPTPAPTTGTPTPRPGFTDQILLFKGDDTLCGFLDYKADIRAGDLIKTAILSENNAQIYSESKGVLVP